MSSILGWAIGVVIPFITGAVTKPVYDLLEKFLPKFESLIPTWAKPLTVSALAAVFTWVGGLLNITLPGDVTTWTPDTVHGLIAAIFAMIIHIATKSTPATPTTPAAPLA